MLRKYLWSAALAVLIAMPVRAGAELRVVATIKPVHSLVAQVMQGIGSPTLLIRGAVSPHTIVLRPSDARALRQADVIFWIGDDLETFMPKALDARRGRQGAVKLSTVMGIRLLKSRTGGAWDADDHDAHDGKEEHADNEGKDHENHAGEHNLHLWLDPINAKAMVRAIAAALIKADAGNAVRYRANADAVSARLDALDSDLRASLAAVRTAPFVVFHDAYHYFERRYGLNAVGSVTLSPEIRPGAKRLHEIRAKLIRSKATCVFSEPQFETKLVATVVRGTGARTGLLDPLGAGLTADINAYERLIRDLAGSMIACLKSVS
jgi:zinc transport system substrate-binding protein